MQSFSTGKEGAGGSSAQSNQQTNAPEESTAQESPRSARSIVEIVKEIFETELWKTPIALSG